MGGAGMASWGKIVSVAACAIALGRTASAEEHQPTDPFERIERSIERHADELAESIEEWAERHGEEWERWAEELERTIEAWAHDQEQVWSAWAEEIERDWDEHARSDADRPKGDQVDETVLHLKRQVESAKKMPLEETIDQTARHGREVVEQVPWETLQELGTIVKQALDPSTTTTTAPEPPPIPSLRGIESPPTPTDAVPSDARSPKRNQSRTRPTDPSDALREEIRELRRELESLRRELQSETR